LDDDQAISLRQLTHPMLHIVLPLPLVNCSVCVDVYAVSCLTISLKLAFVDVPIRPRMDPMPLQLSIHILTLIHRPIVEYSSALACLLIISPIPLINTSITIDHSASPLLYICIFFPLPQVDSPVCVGLNLAVFTCAQSQFKLRFIIDKITHLHAQVERGFG